MHVILIIVVYLLALPCIAVFWPRYLMRTLGIGLLALIMMVGIGAFLPLWAFRGGGAAAADFVLLIVLPLLGIIGTLRRRQIATPSATASLGSQSTHGPLGSRAEWWNSVPGTRQPDRFPLPKQHPRFD